MDTDLLLDATHAALWALVQIVSPVVLPALLAGLIVGLLQAATSVSEASLSFAPKLVTVLISLALFGALMMRILSDFTLELYDRIPALLR